MGLNTPAHPMTADKSPPLPDSVGRIVAEMRRYKDLTPEQIEWLERLAALTDGAEPLLWKVTRPDGTFYTTDGPMDANVVAAFVASGGTVMPLYTAPRPSAALVGGDWYVSDSGSYCVDWDADPKRQLSIMLKPDGTVAFAAYVDGQKLNGNAIGDDFFRALSAVSATPGGGCTVCYGDKWMKDGSPCQACNRAGRSGHAHTTPAPAESLEAVLHKLAAEGPPLTAEHMPLANKAVAITGPVPGAWVKLSEAIEHADTLRAVSGGREAVLLEALREVKLRLHFMGWPAETFWNAGTDEAPRWVEDWRYEIDLIEHALHGSPREYTSRKMGDTKTRLQITTPAAPALPDGWDKTRYSYSVLFNAIAAATGIEGSAITVSVKAFEDAMIAATAAPQREER